MRRGHGTKNTNEEWKVQKYEIFRPFFGYARSDMNEILKQVKKLISKM
jgi:hypothetical protein